MKHLPEPKPVNFETYNFETGGTNKHIALLHAVTAAEAVRLMQLFHHTFDLQPLTVIRGEKLQRGWLTRNATGYRAICMTVFDDIGVDEIVYVDFRQAVQQAEKQIMQMMDTVNNFCIETGIKRIDAIE